MLDELLRHPRLGNAMFEVADVPAEQVRVIHRVVRGQDLGQVPQAQTGLSAHQDHGDPRQISVTVAALPTGGPARGQQTHAFPVPQHMRGQAETAGEFADGEVRVRIA